MEGSTAKKIADAFRSFAKYIAKTTPIINTRIRNVA
jgi:hypothetical protein